MKIRNLKFQILSILLALVMLLGMQPMTVFAEEAGGLKPGDTFYFALDLSRSNTLPELDISGGTEGTDYTYENGVLDIKAAGTYEIKNVDPAMATSDIIKVSAPSGTVNITLSGVKIDAYDSDSKAAFEITGECTTKLIMKDGCINEFDSASDRAGIANHSHPLIIACENAESVTHICSYDCGWLIANTYGGSGTRGSKGAGIGGDSNENGENITITGGYIIAGTVIADGAGIGGGDKGNGNHITFTGGIVAAMSQDVGISGDNITITGGQVHGSTLSHGEGISGKNIKIVPAENTKIYAYNAHDSYDSEAALDGSPFTSETDITELVEGGAFFCYAEHVHSFSTDWTYDDNHHWHAPTCGHNEDISFKMSHSYSTEWKSDGTNHWHECECGVKTEEAVHSGGTATCTKKAICSVCGEEYGELAAHTYSTEWKSDGTNHWHKCECGVKTEEAVHSGGTATCTKKAICSVCGEEYGELAQHSYSTEWKSDGTNHWHECECGVKTEEAAHSGGTATCTKKAICSVCGEEYGELSQHSYGTEWKSDGTNHWHECECGAKTEEAAHSGGTATCKDKAVCSTCGTVYGNLAAHNYKDGKCTVCEAADSNYVPETDSPQTGDTSHIALWIALLLLSGGVVITLTVVDRKKRAVSKI